MKYFLLAFFLVSLFFSGQTYSQDTFKLEDCTKENIDSCVEYADGLYDQEDGEEAIKYYQQLCDLEVGHGCRRIGLIHDLIFETEPELVYEMYLKSCTLGDMIGCTNIADILEYNEDYEQARQYFQQACDNGRFYGCYSLGIHYEYGNDYDYGVEKDLEKASQLYEVSCNDGLAAACLNLGEIYDYDFQNYGLSYKWYKAGCELNDGESCFDLARQYANEKGVEEDLNVEYELYEQSCEFGYIDGCTNLGRAYMEYDDGGKNYKKDYNKGTELLTYACQNGDGDACAGISYAHIKGLGVEESEEKALEFALFGCDEVYDFASGACYNVARTYENGFTGKVDLDLAKQYYQKACDAGDEEACDNAKSLK